MTGVRNWAWLLSSSAWLMWSRRKDGNHVERIRVWRDKSLSLRTRLQILHCVAADGTYEINGVRIWGPARPGENISRVNDPPKSRFGEGWDSSPHHMKSGDANVRD